MRLLHYTGKPFVLNRRWAYHPSRSTGRGWMKPDGLWVSVEGADDWPDFCIENDFRKNHLRYENEVVLGDDRNILRMSSASEMFAFTDMVAFDPKADPSISLTGLNWELVSRLWDGVIITPYLWECRHALFWYYGWDCASGCIWNLNVVREVRTREVNLGDYCAEV